MPSSKGSKVVLLSAALALTLCLALPGPVLAKKGGGEGGGQGGGQASSYQEQPPAWSQGQGQSQGKGQGKGQKKMKRKGSQKQSPPANAPAWGEREKTGTETGQTPPPGFQRNR